MLYLLVEEGFYTYMIKWSRLNVRRKSLQYHRKLFVVQAHNIKLFTLYVDSKTIEILFVSLMDKQKTEKSKEKKRNGKNQFFALGNVSGIHKTRLLICECCL